MKYSLRMKRLGSLLLAVCMVISMMPWSIALDADTYNDGVAIWRYNMHSLHNGRYGTNGYSAAQVTSIWNTVKGHSAFKAIGYAGTNNQPYGNFETDPFCYAGLLREAEKVSVGYGDQAYGWTMVNTNSEADKKEGYAMKIWVPSSDTYTVETNLASCASAQTSPEVEIYIAPASVALDEIAVEEYYFATVTGLNEVTNWNALQDHGGKTIDLAAGEYYVAYQVESNRIWGGSLTLRGTKAPNQVTVNVDYDPTIAIGESVTIPLNAVDSTGAEIDWSTLRDARVEFDREAISAVINDDGTITITAQEDAASGTTASASVYLVVNEAIAWTEFSVKVIDGQFAFEQDELFFVPGGEAQATLIPLFSSSVVVGKITYESSDSRVAAVDANGVVTAGNLGTAVITATMGDLTATCTVTVSDSFVDYKFTEVAETTGTYDLKTFTEYTEEAGSAPWKYVTSAGHNKPSFNYIESGYNCIFLFQNPNGFDWYRIQIRLEEDAKYIGAMLMGQNSASAAADIYLAPIAAEDPTADEYLLMHVSNANRPSVSIPIDETVVGNTVMDLPAGDYYVTFKQTNDVIGGTYRYMYIDTLRMYKVGAYEGVPTESVTISSPNAQILISGETLSASVLPLAAKQSVTWTSSDESIAKIDETGTVTVFKTGRVTITATADDSDVSDSISILASPGAAYDYKFREVGVATSTQFYGGMAVDFKSGEFAASYEASQIVEGSAPWMYVSANQMFTYNPVNDKYGVFMFNSNPGTDHVRIKIKLGDGKYIGALHHTQYGNSANAKIYVAPIDAEDPEAEQYQLMYIADRWESSMPNPAPVTDVGTTELNLAQGEYYVTFRQTDAATGQRYLTVDKFQLYKVGEVELPAEYYHHITVTAPKQEIETGETLQLEAKGYRFDGQEIPSEALTATYASSNNKVALVDENGVVTGYNNGTAVITVAMKNEEGKVQSEEFNVKVNGYLPLASAQIVAPALVEVGVGTPLAIKAKYIDQTFVDLETAEEVVAYTVTEGNATVSEDGVLTANERGTVKIKATVTLDKSSVETAEITIRAAAADDPADFSKLVLEADKTTMSVGESVGYRAGGQFKDGTYRYYTELFTHESNNMNTVSFTNSAPDVVEVDAESGVLRALKQGLAELTLEAVVNGEEISKTLVIAVDEHVLESVTAGLAKESVLVGEHVDLYVQAVLTNGRIVKESDLTLTYAVVDPSVAEIVNGVLIAKTVGTTQIQVTAEMNGVTIVGIADVVIEDDSLASVTASASASSIKPNSEGSQISVTAQTKSGAVIAAENLEIRYESSDPSIATVTESGLVVPAQLGTVTVTVTVAYKGVTQTAMVTVQVKDGKTGSTYMTDIKRQAAKENRANFPEMEEYARGVIENAEKWVGREEYLWNLVTSQDLPRGAFMGTRNHPNVHRCEFCGFDDVRTLGSGNTNYGWFIDVANYPWKVQCPNCMRRFPSNDFGKFYEAGINEHGFFDYEYAKQTASHLLVNEAFPEKGEG